MVTSFFFYDLETTGLSSQFDRVMQFAGQRTNLQLEPIGEPVNELIKLAPDVLPSPSAIMVTGITPQQTLQDGWTEADFLRFFSDQVAVPGTIFVGFNSVRFDDEFMRNLQYRNLYDPYEWQWQDGRGRWDLLDVVRMTRALRPEGISWPFLDDGRPANKLGLLTQLNGLEHAHAHDALSDVQATIAVAKLIQTKQPKLFSWLLGVRTKAAVKQLVEAGQPFVYTSGRYSSDFGHTTVVEAIAPHPSQPASLVYDLRFDPTAFLDLDMATLVERWRWQKDRTEPALPVKILQYNRCPAIAPLGVFDAAAQDRLQLSLATIEKHRRSLKHHPKFADNLQQALLILNQERDQLYAVEKPVEAQLYNGFYPDGDKNLLRAARAAAPADLTTDQFNFTDQRLRTLLPLYKARNYPASLTPDEQIAWETYRSDKLFTGGADSPLAQYFAELQTLASQANLTTDQAYIIEELQLYGQSIMPTDVAG